ncbi:MAG: glutathione S-transferase [Piptocephalis tieghemiana]|nr:MAG: glutathione S-transferase [Piptocephalis tieghemiana]
MTITDYTFYHYDSSALSQASRLVVDLARVPYTPVQVDLLDKPEYFAKEVNPEGKVPVLKLGRPEDKEAICLPESWAIARYVADVSGKLLPQDPLKRARVGVLKARFDEKLHKLFYAFYFAKNGAEKEKVTQEVRDGLAHIEGLVKDQSPNGPYFLGEELSLADPTITPLLACLFACSSPVLGVDIHQDQYPRLKSWIQAMKSLPEWSKAISDDATFIKNMSVLVKTFGDLSSQNEAQESSIKA